MSDKNLPIKLSKLLTTDDFVTCCNGFYENPVVRYFLGEFYHPGGKDLTLKLAKKMGINSSSRVLDVASGEGSTAILLASEYGCEVVGVEMNKKLLEIANKKVKTNGLSEMVSFVQGKAEKLVFDKHQFDHIICECSFCLFTQKEVALNNFFRLLTEDGTIGISDFVLRREIPFEIKRVIFRVMCLSGALREEEYRKLILQTGFKNLQFIDKRFVLEELHSQLRKKYLGLKLVGGVGSKIGQIDMSSLDLDYIKMTLQYFKEFLNNNYGTYKILIATKN